jgi:hypothetical protein
VNRRVLIGAISFRERPSVSVEVHQVFAVAILVDTVVRDLVASGKYLGIEVVAVGGRCVTVAVRVERDLWTAAIAHRATFFGVLVVAVDLRRNSVEVSVSQGIEASHDEEECDDTKQACWLPKSSAHRLEGWADPRGGSIFDS